MKAEITLRFKTKRYTRENEIRPNVKAEEWPKTVVDWLWPAMENFERSTALRPESTTKWDHLKHALPNLSKVKSWDQFTSIPIQSLEVQHLRDLYVDIDDTFHKLWGGDTGAVRSAFTRKFLLDYLLSMRKDGTLSRVRTAFSPKRRSSQNARKLISDQILIQEGGQKLAPVGALAHSNAADLKKATKLRLEKDLKLISDACVKELDSYEETCKELEKILDKKVCDTTLTEALRKINSGEIKSIKARVTSLTDEQQDELIAHYARIDASANAHDKNCIKGAVVLTEKISKSVGIEFEEFKRCARYTYFPYQITVVAAILLLQIHTAWNISSVLVLNEDGIQKIKADRYLIQSFKDRTGDDTPQVLIEGDDNPALRVIRMLTKRLKEIKKRGWADEDEKCLWLSPRTYKDKSKGIPTSNLTKGLTALRQKYNLPHFTFEQIRPQKLTLISLEQGAIAAAEIAGHSSYATIGRYIDHLISSRLNSSINLEFQKRWEAEIIKEMNGQDVLRPLTPIGDGASCKNPTSPPQDEWIKVGLCDAENCHTGSGCINRVINITTKTIEEVVLVKRFYMKNWKRLYANNVEEFLKKHASRMEFNLYFYEYLKKGPYRHLIHEQQ